MYKDVKILLKKAKSNEILSKWDINKVMKPKKEKKPFDWSQYEQKSTKEAGSKTPGTVKLFSNGESKQVINKQNNGIAYTALKEEPKMITYKPEPNIPVKPLPRQEPNESEPKVEILDESTRPLSSQKKTFYPNLTNRVYSPIKTSFSALHVEEQHTMDLSDVQKPPLYTLQTSPESYIKNIEFPSTYLNENSTLNTDK